MRLRRQTRLEPFRDLIRKREVGNLEQQVAHPIDKPRRLRQDLHYRVERLLPLRRIVRTNVRYHDILTDLWVIDGRSAFGGFLVRGLSLWINLDMIFVAILADDLDNPLRVVNLAHPFQDNRALAANGKRLIIHEMIGRAIRLPLPFVDGLAGLFIARRAHFRFVLAGNALDEALRHLHAFDEDGRGRGRVLTFWRGNFRPFVGNVVIRQNRMVFRVGRLPICLVTLDSPSRGNPRRFGLERAELNGRGPVVIDHLLRTD